MLFDWCAAYRVVVIIKSGGSPLGVIWELWFSLSTLKTTYTSFKTQEKTVQKMGLKNTTSAERPAPVLEA
jgi:hypothetical protein